MREQSGWEILPPEQTQKFIKDVRSEAHASLFDGKYYELWAYELPFLDGYSRYRLDDIGAIPPFSMDYISNGENHYYLDGSAHPVMLLIQIDAFRLKKESVLSYLDFFDDVVLDPRRKAKFIIDAYDTGYAGAQAMEHHFKAINYTDKREIAEFDTFFILKIPILYNGETFFGSVRIEKTGKIIIESPIHADLTGHDFNTLHPLRYTHPHGKALLHANSEILKISPLGKEMLDFAASYQIDLTFVSGITRQGFNVRGKRVFITAPCDISTASPYQVIDLAGALRESEIIQMTGDRQEKFPPDADGFAEENHGRNLDILLTLCKIGKELEDNGCADVLQILRKAGLGPLYSGYISGRGLEELMDIYAETYARAMSA